MEVQEVEKQITPQGCNQLNLNVRNSSAQITHFLNKQVTRGKREGRGGKSRREKRKKGKEEEEEEKRKRQEGGRKGDGGRTIFG